MRFGCDKSVSLTIRHILLPCSRDHQVQILLLVPAGEGAPVNSNECFLQGPRDWLRFWSVRIGGGFVCHCVWVALGVGFGRSAFALVLVVPRGGRFVCLNVASRLVLVFCLRVWCLVRRFRFPALLVGCGPSHWFFFGRSARAVVSYRFCSVPRVGRPMPKLGNLRCKLAVFK